MMAPFAKEAQRNKVTCAKSQARKWQRPSSDWQSCPILLVMSLAGSLLKFFKRREKVTHTLLRIMDGEKYMVTKIL